MKWKHLSTLGRLTLLSKSHLQPDAADAVYSDVTGNSTPDSTPLGSINRARWSSEVASRKARLRLKDETTTGTGTNTSASAA
jgi:hypothetical protein